MKSYSLLNGTIPAVLSPRDGEIDFKETLAFIRYETNTISSLLLKHGAVLLRGFPIKDAEEFSKSVQALNMGGFMNYVGGDSPRIKVAEGIFTSTEAPPWLKIPQHNELSYSAEFPSHIFFFCAFPPIANGETPITDARKILQSIDPAIKEEFFLKGLKYRSAYHGGKGLIAHLIKAHRSWMDVFGTKEREQVETICQKRNISYRWKKNGWLILEETRPAFNIHPKTGEMVWFNQAHIFKLSKRLLGFWRYLGTKLLYYQHDTLFHDVQFADGSPIPNAYLQHIMDRLNAHTIAFPWQKGDLLILDNILTMHGRESFKGPRKVLTAMTLQNN